jgi:hypothetical protein
VFPFLALRLDSNLFGTSVSCTSADENGCDDLERADYWLKTSEAVWPLHIVAYTVIFMAEPTRVRAFGSVQVLSMILGVVSKGLFMYRDPSKATWLLGGPLFATAWIAIGSGQRCRRIKAEFSVEQVRKFVHVTLPAATFGVLPSMIFLLGESMACLEERLGVDEESDLNNPGAKMCSVDTYCAIGCMTSNDMYVCSASADAAFAPPHPRPVFCARSLCVTYARAGASVRTRLLPTMA